MKEIRIHGRGGMGSVKAAEVLVYAAVMDGKYGNSIPFFGFERQGAPVTAFVRIGEEPIRPKNRVYHPDVLIVLDSTIMNAVNVFEGVKGNGVLVLNSNRPAAEIEVPEQIATVAVVDASAIAMEVIGRPISNTVMLGAFLGATGLVSLEEVGKRAAELWGEKNREALKCGYEAVEVRKAANGGV